MGRVNTTNLQCVNTSMSWTANNNYLWVGHEQILPLSIPAGMCRPSGRKYTTTQQSEWPHVQHTQLLTHRTKFSQNSTNISSLKNREFSTCSSLTSGSQLGWLASTVPPSQCLLNDILLLGAEKHYTYNTGIWVSCFSGKFMSNILK